MRNVSRFRGSALVASSMLASCAFVPQEYPRLDEARIEVAAAAADRRVACVAPAELGQAIEALDRANRARDTLDDPAEVDHLAYIARQRAAIAREDSRHAAASRGCP